MWLDLTKLITPDAGGRLGRHGATFSAPPRSPWNCPLGGPDDENMAKSCLKNGSYGEPNNNTVSGRSFDILLSP